MFSIKQGHLYQFKNNKYNAYSYMNSDIFMLHQKFWYNILFLKQILSSNVFKGNKRPQTQLKEITFALYSLDVLNNLIVKTLSKNALFKSYFTLFYNYVNRIKINE